MSTTRRSEEKTPGQNISKSVYFVMKGAEKRRQMATQRAQSLQRDYGVIPKLKCVK